MKGVAEDQTSTGTRVPQTDHGVADFKAILSELAAGRREWRRTHQPTSEPVARELSASDVVERVVADLRTCLFPLRLGPADLRRDTEDSFIAQTLAHAKADLLVQACLELPWADTHRETGIDILSGDVIGANSMIGSHVRIYQGVTLGGKSVPNDGQDDAIKGLPRHPSVESDVVIFSVATVLGRVTIGRGSILGGNVWMTVESPAASSLCNLDVSSRSASPN